MKIISLHRPQQGLSLIELMIAITLSLVLTLGVIQIFSSSKQTNRVQTALGGVQENARFALDLLSYDLRMAGNIGCNSSAAVDILEVKLPAIDNGISGFEKAQLGATVFPLLDGKAIPSSTNVTDGTDVIVVRYASPNTTTVTSGSGNEITLATNITAKNGDPFIISDCQHADIFTAVAGDDEDKSVTTIKLNAGALSKTYGADAEVAFAEYIGD